MSTTGAFGCEECGGLAAHRGSCSQVPLCPHGKRFLDSCPDCPDGIGEPSERAADRQRAIDAAYHAISELQVCGAQGRVMRMLDDALRALEPFALRTSEPGGADDRK